MTQDVIPGKLGAITRVRSAWRRSVGPQARMASYAMFALMGGIGLSQIGALLGSRWLGVPAFALAGWLLSSAKYATDAPAPSRRRGVLAWFDARFARHPEIAVVGLTLLSGGIGFMSGFVGYGAGTLPLGIAFGAVCAVVGGTVGAQRIRSDRAARK